MKYKLNGLSTVGNITTQKEIITTAIDLMGEGYIFTSPELELALMMAMVGVLENDEKVFDDLEASKNVQNDIILYIEPAFNEIIMKDEMGREIFYKLLNCMEIYYEKQLKAHDSLTSLLNNFFGDLKTLKPTDVLKLLGQIKEKFEGGTVKPKEEVKSDEDIKQEAIEDIENAKMKALIEKYQRIEG